MSRSLLAASELPVYVGVSINQVTLVNSQVLAAQALAALLAAPVIWLRYGVETNLP